MGDENYLYAVMKMHRNVIVADADGEKSFILGGIAGYIPVFETYEQAKEESCDGKFKILTIEKNI